MKNRQKGATETIAREQANKYMAKDPHQGNTFAPIQNPVNENKYYTPTVEEVIETIINGESVYATMIEREDLLELESDGKIDTLEKFIDLQNWDNETGYSIDANLYRLKYLDKSDIESLGFKLTAEYDRETTYGGAYETKIEFEKNAWELGGVLLRYKPESNKIEIVTVDEGYNVDGPNHSVKFKGTIKNLTELKKLLKQLNIE